MPLKLELMTDYQCWPLWRCGDSGVGNVDPETLPLSTETRARLDGWAARYDGWLDLDDPARSPQVPSEEVDAFEAEGMQLWARVRAELGPEYEVVYRSIKQRRVLGPQDA